MELREFIDMGCLVCHEEARDNAKLCCFDRPDSSLDMALCLLSMLMHPHHVGERRIGCTSQLNLSSALRPRKMSSTFLYFRA